jgi:two-component system chemotaxis response regulator CheB
VTTSDEATPPALAGEPDNEAFPPIVALVCSAGGLEALRSVLSPLPESFPAAIVVLQHLSPSHPSQLSSLLARASAMPVATAADGTRLRAGDVVVIPPGTHALVAGGDRIALVESDGPPPYRPSADLLLSSLAVSAGRRTIAVVLSGLGHDGATGAAAVHRFGGVVIAADEATSEHFAMPAAAIARDEAVDYVRPVTEIPALLEKLVAPSG